MAVPSGHGAQVVTVSDLHTYQLDEDELKKVLMNEEIKDLPVVVISIAGTFRGGKSFLMNFFLRYLKSSSTAQANGSWLGGDNDPLTGFSWRGGSKRNTTGILLWSEPITTTLPSGEKVAIILMDTQGTFDNTSTVSENSTIFAFSTLLSSVQIYNVIHDLQEDDLQYLQIFTEYGKMVQGGDIKAFQTMEFLIRDWANSFEFDYGEEGGDQYLQDKLQISENMPKDLKDVREHIRNCFENVMCFLMPHPGLKVIRPEFQGSIKDLDNDFKTYLLQLVSSLFSPDKLKPKLVHGQRLKASELCAYFKTYMDLFNSGQLITPTSITQATSDTLLLLALNDAREVYDKGMDIDCGSGQFSILPDDLRDIHNKHINEAVAAFNAKKQFVSKADSDRRLTELTQVLQNRLTQFMLSNQYKTQTTITNAKEAYNRFIENVSKGHLNLIPGDLEALHRDAVTAAMTVFDHIRKNISGRIDNEREDFKKSFDQQLENLKVVNDQNNKAVILEQSSEFWTAISAIVNKPQIVSSDNLVDEMNKASRRAIQNLKESRNRNSSYWDIYDDQLLSKIQGMRSSFITINNAKIERERLRREEERRRREEQLRRQREEEYRRRQRWQEQQRRWEEKQRREEEERRRNEESSCAIL